MNGCRLERERGLVLWQTVPEGEEAYFTVGFEESGEEVGAVCRRAYTRLAERLERDGLAVVQERLFGSLKYYSAAEEARRQVLAAGSLWAGQPFSYVQGRPLWGDGLAGIQVHAVRTRRSGAPAEPIVVDGQRVGTKWASAGATYYWFQRMHGRGPAAAVPKAQSETMFLRAEAALRAQGLDYGNVVRTWIYLSDILSWYDGFNEVRNRLYGNWGLMPQLNAQPGGRLRLPSSTGIRGDNPMGAACTMDFLAVRPAADGAPAIHQMTNPKQKDAFKYQKAFSRGSMIRGAGLDEVHISGTAAIDEAGESLFPGDAHRQIHHTLEVVESLIAPSGAKLTDLSGATVFLKRAADVPTCREVLKTRGLEDLPAVWVLGDVCRDELLFEMDALALGPFAP